MGHRRTTLYFHGIFLVIAFAVLLTSECSAQISPGDLTYAHAKYEGLSNCTKCHVLGERLSNDNCLNCHGEIKKLQNNNEGYHSSADVKNKNCWKCHSEHNGRDFKIINFYPDKFDHSKAGFVLLGKHSQIKCSDCHQKKYIKQSNLMNRKNTYLGLSSKCVSCHEDYHQNTLGTNCSSCHDYNNFKTAAKFNHDSAKFKLTGAHEKVECDKCHQKGKRNGKDFQVFKGVKFSGCENCHKDIHNGKLGSNCQSCHTVTSFNAVNKGAFDHSKTNFPLLGRHTSVKCNDCHKGGIGKKLLFGQCINCHTDYHHGDFTKNGKPADCEQCHNVNGFSPSTFTLEDHGKINFVLTGSHLAVSCRSCHFVQSSWHFKNIGMNCIDCHKNIHGSELTNSFLPDNNCTKCHVTESWKSISFDHNTTKFKLEGKHKDVTCRKCHVTEKNGITVYAFKSLDARCETCHKDIHMGQFAENGNTNCLRCHYFGNWKPVKFDHNKTKFALEGAHKKIDCSKCHTSEKQNGVAFIKYKLKEFKCAFCHS